MSLREPSKEFFLNIKRDVFICILTFHQYTQFSSSPCPHFHVLASYGYKLFNYKVLNKTSLLPISWRTFLEIVQENSLKNIDNFYSPKRVKTLQKSAVERSTNIKIKAGFTRINYLVGYQGTFLAKSFHDKTHYSGFLASASIDFPMWY